MGGSRSPPGTQVQSLFTKYLTQMNLKYFRTKQRNSDLCLSKSQRYLYCPDNQGLCFPQSLPEKKEGA